MHGKDSENEDIASEKSVVNLEIDTHSTYKQNFKAKWTGNSTKYLIQKRLSKENDFQRPKCKKIKLWQDIAKDVNSTFNVNMSAEECDNKYRNLLKTYKINIIKKNSTGESQITWEHFEEFDAILGCKASITPSKDIVFDSLDPSAGPSNRADIFDERESVETMSTPNTTPKAMFEATPKKVSCKTLKLNEYLYLKNEREENKVKKSEDFKERKWREEMELRQNETAAVLKLAEAISNSSAKPSENSL